VPIHEPELEALVSKAQCGKAGQHSSSRDGYQAGRGGPSTNRTVSPDCRGPPIAPPTGEGRFGETLGAYVLLRGRARHDAPHSKNRYSNFFRDSTSPNGDRWGHTSGTRCPEGPIARGGTAGLAHGGGGRGKVGKFRRGLQSTRFHERGGAAADSPTFMKPVNRFGFRDRNRQPRRVPTGKLSCGGTFLRARPTPANQRPTHIFVMGTIRFPAERAWTQSNSRKSHARGTKKISFM